MRKFVVIIDDDIDEIAFLRHAIEEVDPSVRCTSFTSPQDALQALSENDMRMPDVICVDYNMPILTGIDCLRLFGALSKLNHTKMVASSSHLPTSLEQDFRNHGASYVFEKPTTATDYHKIAALILDAA